jgi:hydrogenase expression/formation protein HypD
MTTTTTALVDDIRRTAAAVGRPVSIMEICGTHTVSLFRTGVKSLLPASMRMVSGPGCPVCVTSQGYIDAACELAGRPGVTICTYGDMVRVPGRAGSLEHRRAGGADIRVVYSARDAVRRAAERPDHEIVFLAVGFETTAPASAAAVLEADARGLTNFTILPGHKLVIPAMSALLAGGDVPIDGFLCPGHVSIIIGAGAYQPIVDVHRRPCVVAGFEPDNMLTGILHVLQQLRDGQARLENVYGVAVTRDGNTVARGMLDRVFEPGDTVWRAMGTIAGSGLVLREGYRQYDARERFGIAFGPDQEPPGCRCGEVIQGRVDPVACNLFGTACTPTRPIGPCMVSSEGTCAAWYKYGRIARPAEA